VSRFRGGRSWRRHFQYRHPSVYASRETPVPLKSRYMKKDLADWSAPQASPIKDPRRYFRSQRQAMRGCIWLRRIWCRSRARYLKPIGVATRTSPKDEVLTEICKGAVSTAKSFSPASASRRSGSIWPIR